MSDRPVRLPRTATRRGALEHLKLLSRVDRSPEDGFGFHGTFLRPGAVISEDHLWPDPDYPACPVLLECAGTIRPSEWPWAHRRYPCLYLLWRYDRDRGEFEEVARSSAYHTEWVHDLAPIAARLLQPPRKPPATDTRRVAERISWMLELELEDLDEDGRRAVLDVIYNQLAARIAVLA